MFVRSKSVLKSLLLWKHLEMGCGTAILQQSAARSPLWKHLEMGCGTAIGLADYGSLALWKHLEMGCGTAYEIGRVLIFDRCGNTSKWGVERRAPRLQFRRR